VVVQIAFAAANFFDQFEQHKTNHATQDANDKHAEHGDSPYG
jgi:hypothetical protein